MSSGLSITKALYGTGSNTVDVTSTVTSKIKDGLLSFTVSPTSLNVDDPSPGQPKQLDVTYTINGGASNTKTVKDNDVLLIDAPPQRSASGLQIVKAEYGYSGNMTDVTDAIQSYVSDGKINITVSPKSVGIPDPNPNKQKYLSVQYSLNGATSSETITDGQSFRLSAPPLNEPTKPLKQNVNSLLSSVLSSIFKYGLPTFFWVWSLAATIEFGKLIEGNYYLFIGLGLIPYIAFWGLPVFVFVWRLFASQSVLPSIQSFTSTLPIAQ
jgi:hypothetical protein